MPPSITLVVRSGTAIHCPEIVEEPCRNPKETVVNRRDAGFSTVHPGFAV